MTTTDQQHTYDQQSNQIARLRAIWQATHRRRDMLAFIRSCPATVWPALAEEYDRLANLQGAVENRLGSLKDQLVSCRDLSVS